MRSLPRVRRSARAASFVLLASASALAADPVPGLRAAPGVEVTLFADTPQVHNPTAMDVDPRGRLWITEAVNYRQWRGRNPGLHRDDGDRVVILEDTDGDGRCDSSKVFVQDVDLVAPLGICVLDDRVLVSCSPDVFAYFDDDGDDVADRREVFLTGFGGHDHDHGVHSLSWSPDGRLVVAVGNAGPHLVTDRRGFALRSGSFYTGGGEFVADNRPGLLSDDGRVWTGGLVLRVDPDARDLEPLAHDFRNPYEVASDAFGDLFVTDNDDDGNQGCRATWVMPGGGYGYTGGQGSRAWQADRRPGQSTQSAHWHADDPGVAPPGTITGAGGPTGVTVYEGHLLPDMRGVVFGCDAGRSTVFALRPSLVGSGIVLAQDVLLAAVDDPAAPDEAHMFRPSDVAVAPDGTVYVCDWWDPGVGGHLAQDGAARGRVLRLAPPGHVTRAPALVLDTPAGRSAALGSPTPSVAARGRSAVAALGLGALPELATLLRDASCDARLRARAAFLVARLGPDGLGLLEALRADADPRLRVARARALASTWPLDGSVDARRVAALCADLARDDDPFVRREACALLVRRGVALPDDAVLRELAARTPAGDRTSLEALGLALERQPHDLDAVLAACAGPERARRDAWFELLWRMHPPAAVPDWKAIALDEGAWRGREDEARRLLACDALAFTPGRAAAEAMLDVALASDGALRERATFWLRQRDGDDWAGYDLLRHLGREVWTDDELRWSSGLVRAGTVEVDVDVSGATQLALVVTDGGDGNGCDWVDWLRPVLVDADGAELDLAGASWLSAECAWGSVNRGKDCEGGALDVDGVLHERGIGTHAPTTIVFEVPDGFVRLRALAACDDGGTRQGNSPTSVEFRVYADRPRDDSALLARQALVLDAAADDGEREDAAEALALDPSGGAWLLDLASRRTLPDVVRDAVAEAIWSNPDLGVRALASEHFARPGGAALPPVHELLALDGDPARGREVFRGETAACVRCHAFDGLGASIGPDLTAIRTKSTRPALLDAILNPSAAIAFGYDTHAVRTVDGRVVTGLLRSGGARTVLEDAQGGRHVFDAGEIAETWTLARSLMPDNVALGLEPQEIADLLAFLLDDRDAPPTRGGPIDLLAHGLEGWTGVFTDPSASLADVFDWDGAVLHDSGNPVGYMRTEARYTSYELEVEWRFPPGSSGGNSGVLLRVQEPDTVWPRSIESQLQAASAGDIWNIGKFPMLVDGARTSGRRTVKLAPSSEKPIGEWNRYRIVLDGPDLSLFVNDVLQNEARWCAEWPGFVALQSEGVPIEFRRVVLTPLTR